MFGKSIRIAKQLGDLLTKASGLWWIGTIYGKLKQKSLAIEFLESSLAIYKKLGVEKKTKEIKKFIDYL